MTLKRRSGRFHILRLTYWLIASVGSGYANSATIRMLAVSLVAVAGVALTSLATLQLRNADRLAYRRQAELHARDHAAAIKREFDRVMASLAAVRAYYSSSTVITPQDFEAYVSSIFGSDAPHHVFEWVPRITAGQRRAFETEMQSAGYRRFQITERSPDGRTVRAGDRPEYFPIVLFHPREGNEAAFGYDAASAPHGAEVIRRIYESGGPTATPAFHLMQDRPDILSTVVYAPVFESGARVDTAAERRNHLRGLTEAALRIGAIVDAGLSYMHVRNVDVEVLDASAHNRTLCARTSVDPGGVTRAACPELQIEEPVSLADRTYMIRCTPAPWVPNWNAALTFVFGTVLTGLLVSWLTLMGTVAGRTRSLVRRRTRTLRKATRAATAAARAKSEFLANMSHEIRTPLNGIIGNLELLRRDGLDRDQQDCIDVAKRSGLLLMSILTDVLTLSKLESGTIPGNRGPVALAREIEAVLECFAIQACEKGVCLSYAHGADVPDVVVGDAGRLRQVLLNLVGNALKFTDAGSVTVRSNVLLYGQSASELQIVVADTGCGVAEADMERIFQPFEQADTSSTRRHGGTGLGLAICKRLVEAMGGSIGVSRNDNAGSDFWIRVPLERAVAENNIDTTAPELVQCPAGQPRGRILIAEDNSVNQRVLRSLVERLGFEVDVAWNGEEAVVSCQRASYSAVLMDCQMPVMDGYAATDRIRAAELGRNRTPIIAVTGHALEGDRERCEAAGMDGYVAKPVILAALAAAINEHVPLPRN